MKDNSPLWLPTSARRPVSESHLAHFMKEAQLRFQAPTPSFQNFYQWTIEHPTSFWSLVWDYAQVKGEKGAETLSYIRGHDLKSARWFPQSSLNFAENLLSKASPEVRVLSYAERQKRRVIHLPELNSAVANLQQHLTSHGISIGDRVAAIISNGPEALIGMLATTSIGGVWSSCSPDFGVDGVIDRFSQISPKVLIAVDGYYFKEKPISCREKLEEMLKRLPSLERVVLIPALEDSIPLKVNIPVDLFEQVTQGEQVTPLFTPLPFDHPLYILFSSGTTGKPKCIVHRAGGVLLEHLKELLLHTDLQRSDLLFYQTTCGWMMWNWLVSGLATGASLLLYDGFPLLDEGRYLWDLAERENISVFGTNAKFLAECERLGVSLKGTFDKKPLRAILSTGSPLLPHSYDYVYREFPPHVQLSSISGGTDIVGCFALGAPTVPVVRGELQTRSLGLQVEVWNEDGTPLVGERGELVCTSPFPSMPVGFWGDPSGEKYHQAYFSRFPGVWHHGDYVEVTNEGGMIFYGRSDAVLNPGGVRIGTAEIYAQLEYFTEIADAVCVGQRWNDDERIILFIKLHEGKMLSEELINSIKARLRSYCSPFHVPKKILQVLDVPRTQSGKVVELAVRKAIHGEPVTNVTALSNPSALEYFRDRKELLVE